jgi:hypothetical protein
VSIVIPRTWCLSFVATLLLGSSEAYGQKEARQVVGEIDLGTLLADEFTANAYVFPKSLAFPDKKIVSQLNRIQLYLVDSCIDIESRTQLTRDLADRPRMPPQLLCDPPTEVVVTNRESKVDSGKTFSFSLSKIEISDVTTHYDLTAEPACYFRTCRVLLLFQTDWYQLRHSTEPWEQTRNPAFAFRMRWSLNGPISLTSANRVLSDTPPTVFGKR